MTFELGGPVDEIADLVETGAFDAVVMATHGRSGVGRVLLGSVAKGVLERVNVNVVLLHVRSQTVSAQDRQGRLARGEGTQPPSR